MSERSRGPGWMGLGCGDPRRPGWGTSAFVSRALGGSQGWGDVPEHSSAFRHAGHAENLPSLGSTSLSQVRYSVPLERGFRPFHGDRVQFISLFRPLHDVTSSEHPSSCTPSLHHSV